MKYVHFKKDFFKTYLLTINYFLGVFFLLLFMYLLFVYGMSVLKKNIIIYFITENGICLL